MVSKFASRLAVGLAFVWFLLFSFLSIATVVHAQEMKRAEHIILGKDQVVDENYFAAGEAVTILGTVNGDVYAAGGKLIIDGTVNGDLLVAGGNVTIRGVVAQDVRVFGGQVTILGQVGGNVTAGGGTVTVSDEASIDGSLVTGGSTVSVFGPVAKSATVGGEDVTLGGSIGGNTLVGAEDLTLTPQAKLQGNLTYYSEGKANVPSGLVAGTVSHKTPPRPARDERKEKAGLGGLWTTLKLWSVLSSLVIGLLLLKLSTKILTGHSDMVGRHPWKSLGVGFVTLIIVPVAAFILLITVIGVPLALIVLLAYAVAIYLSKIVVAFYVGRALVERTGKKVASGWALLLGLLVWAAVTILPVIGGLASFITLLLGLGAIVLYKKELYHTLSSRKVI